MDSTMKIAIQSKVFKIRSDTRKLKEEEERIDRSGRRKSLVKILRCR